MDLSSHAGLNPKARILLSSVFHANLFFAALLLGCELAVGNDWSRFRGPDGNGHARASNLPIEWSEQSNIAWSVPVPGQGHSSPVIANGQVWLTSSVTQPLTDAEKQQQLKDVKNPDQLQLVGKLTLMALCYDQASGTLLHEIELFATDKPEPIHYTNTYASPTPVLAGGRVYAHFGTYGTACIEADSGRVVWKNADLHVDHQNGPGSSPVVWQDLLIVHFDGIDAQFLVALRLSDGSVAWKTQRSGEMDPRPEQQKAYCTPVIVDTPQGPEVISPAANWVYGYDPRTGSELWKAHYGGLGFSTVPCPVVGHGMAYVCTSFGKSQLLAVKYGGRGDVTDTHIAWTFDSQMPKKPSVALLGNELYVCNDTGILTCLDALTGEQLWRERLGGNHDASPLVVGNLIYFFDQEGKTTIIRGGRSFDQVAVNTLNEGCHASPAVADEALFLRTDTRLIRIESTK